MRFLRNIPIRHRALQFSYDVLVIFFSITLSLVFDEWREDRKERKLETFYLKGFLQDLDEDIKELKSDLKQYQHMRNGFAFYLNYDVEKNQYPDSLQYYSSALYGTTGLIPNNSRYEALKNTGKLDVIESEEILGGLLDIYQDKLPILLSATQGFSKFKNEVLLRYLENHLSGESYSLDPSTEVHLLRDRRFRIYLDKDGVFEEIISRYQRLLTAEKNLKRAIEQELATR